MCSSILCHPLSNYMAPVKQVSLCWHRLSRSMHHQPEITITLQMQTLKQSWHLNWCSGNTANSYLQTLKPLFNIWGSLEAPPFSQLSRVRRIGNASASEKPNRKDWWQSGGDRKGVPRPSYRFYRPSSEIKAFYPSPYPSPDPHPRNHHWIAHVSSSRTFWQETLNKTVRTLTWLLPHVNSFWVSWSSRGGLYSSILESTLKLF